MPRPKQFTDEELRQRKNARSKQRYAENREAIAATKAQKFRERYANDADFRRACIERTAAARKAKPEYTRRQNAKRRAADPEKAKAESREWFASNPDKRRAYEQNRRAKKRALKGSISPNIKRTLDILQKGKCACCRTFLAGKAAHLDHILPLALGGEHADRNMQLLCQPCNQQKHAKHPVDFMQAKGYLL